MATTTLKLYNTKLNIRRNMVLDDIDAYLNALPSTYKRVINDFQYIKIDKELDIKLNMIRDYKNFRYNYLSIQEGNITYYFYITKYSYEASDTIRLHLVMDVLNFMYDEFGFNFTNETFVIREHRDRFFEGEEADLAWYRKVDYVNEELNPELLLNSKDEIRRDYPLVYDRHDWDMKWYIIIESTNVADKIGSYIHFVPEKSCVLTNVITNDSNYGTTPHDVLVAGIEYYPTNKSETSKIIECPYCPFNITYNQETYVNTSTTQKFSWGAINLTNPLPSGTYMSFSTTEELMISNAYKVDGRDWTFSEMLGHSDVYQCVAVSFRKAKNTTHLYNLFNKFKLDTFYFEDLDVEKTTLNDTDAFNKLYESKLYHSAFYLNKFSYRNLDFDFKYENILEYDNTSNYELNYCQGATSGEGLFEIKLNNITYRNPFDTLYFTYSVSNEYPLINDEYLNYIRNGYQYDKSQRDWGLVSNILGMGTNLLGGSIGAITGNAKATSKGLMGAATGGIKAGIDYAKASDSIEHNKKSAMMQGINVVNSNDLYLSDIVNEKLTLYRYRLKEIDEDNLFNLFRLRGYKTNCYKIPDLDTRRNYNYIECFPFFSDETDSMLTNYIDDIKLKFEEGITLYHKCSGSFMYDLEEQYENYEVFLKPRNEA